VIGERHARVVTSLRSDHSYLTSAGFVSNQAYGRAATIGAVDDERCTGTRLRHLRPPRRPARQDHTAPAVDGAGLLLPIRIRSAPTRSRGRIIATTFTSATEADRAGLLGVAAPSSDGARGDRCTRFASRSSGGPRSSRPTRRAEARPSGTAATTLKIDLRRPTPIGVQRLGDREVPRVLRLRSDVRHRQVAAVVGATRRGVLTGALAAPAVQGCGMLGDASAA
jgi:hypothetical protein